MTNTTKALRVNTDNSTELIDLARGEDGYTQLHNAVGGYIEMVPLMGEVTIVVNEEGKIRRLPFNQVATSVWETFYGRTDVMVGDAVLVGPADDDGEPTDVPDHVVESVTQFAAKLKELQHG